MTNDLLAQLDALAASPEVLDQNEARASARKGSFVKAYNHIRARTHVGTTERDGRRFLRLDWTELEIIQSDVPMTLTEDYEEIPWSERAVSGMGFFLKSLAALGKNVTQLDGQVVEYKLDVHTPLDRDGKARTNAKGFQVDIWHWAVVSVGGAGQSNGAKPVMDDATFEAKLPLVAGLTHAAAVEAVGADVISRGVLTKRIAQVDGKYELLTVTA